MLTADNPLDLFRLDGRVALVTGGSRGLGAAIAEALSWAGASVAVMSRNSRSLSESAERIGRTTGGTAIAVPGDVSDDKDVVAAIERTVAELGGLDILVNNAGINVRGPIKEIDRATFERSMAVNVTGAWGLCKAAGPHLKASGYGRVINISSTFGLVGVADRTAYAASKGALVQITRRARHGVGGRQRDREHYCAWAVPDRYEHPFPAQRACGPGPRPGGGDEALG